MRTSNWIAGAAIVFVVIALTLTFDPLGFFEGAPDPTVEDDLVDDGLSSTGLKGLGERKLPDADPETWEGEPVGRLVLTLGQATLQGTVTGEGEPLRFARVRPVLPPPYDAVAVRTTKTGRWEIAGLPDGTHELRAAAKSYVPRTAIAPPVAGEQTAVVDPIDLRLRPENRNAILVKVTDFLGRPIPGAKVLATTAPWDLHLAMGPEVAGIRDVKFKRGFTDEQGRVRLGPLAPEEYGVVASAPGYVNAAVQKLVVAAGRARSIGIVLVEGVAIRGRVTDPEGGPIEGAVIMGMAQPSFHSSLTTRSAADGTFVLDGLRKGPYFVIAFSEAHGAVMVPGKAPGSIDIKLAGTGLVKGKAVWEDGSPVTAGVVRPFKDGPFEYVYSQVHPIASDGTFQFRMPKGKYNCRVQTPEGHVGDGTMVDVEIGETSTVEVKVPRSAVVRGVVMDEAGHHVADAEVFVMQGGFPASPSREQYARTGPDGVFEVPGLTTETIDLHVQHSDYADTKIRVTPQPGDEAKEVSVRLRKGASVTGRVTDAEGRGIPGEQVNLALGWFDARQAFTNDEGRYLFEAVAPGTYMVTTGPFEQGARGLSKTGIEVGIEGVVTVDFQNPAAGGKVTGKVSQSGAPVAGATVTLTDARGPEKAVVVTTDEAGAFVAEGLQYGSVRIVARTGRGLTGSARVGLAQGVEVPDVPIFIGTSSVRARIVDPAGEPVPGCWLSLEVADGADLGWSRVKDNGNSDVNGLYRSKSVLPGRYVLRVNRAEYAQLVTAAFDLAEGEDKNLGDLTLTTGAVLKGEVRDDAGAPVENATVSLRDMQGRKVQLFSMATSGSDGKYAMNSVEPGRYTVHFEAKGHAPDEQAVEVTAEGATADGTLTRGGTVAVRVEDQGGAPLEDVRIRLFDDQGREVTRTISLANFDSGRRFTGADGRTALSDLAAGTYLVRCEKQGWVVVGAEPRVRVTPGATAAARVVLEPAR